nr:reverse transcriptase domain-containing protein [Tanacetum cinerariifolium]
MASSSGSGTLPDNTITNPKEDLKGITTRSGVAYQGPTIPTPSKVVKQGNEPVVALVSAPMPNLKPSIPYPSRRDNERRRDQANEQIKKLYEIYKDMSYESSFTDALILMPKFDSTLKALIGNKEKLSEMARTPMNEHCSAVILNKLPKKLGDPGKFLIPCEFPGMDGCLALADLGASINLMPLFMWKELSLPELTPTCMTLELADRSVSKLIGIAKEVQVKVGMFHFPADFVVVDFEPDPRVPLILESPTPSDDPIVSTTSSTLTLFGNGDFLVFEEANAFIGLEDGPDSPEFDPSYYDPDGDILILEAILNSDPTPSLPDHEQFVPSFKNELKACEAKTIKSFVDEPPKVELKDLPPQLGDEEKAALIKVLKSHKRAIAWKLSVIQGINPEFYTHKILMEEDYKPAVQHQRRVNPKIHDVIKKEVEKLLDAGLIYPISNSPWVSPVHCVPKKGGFTIVKNEENELIPTRLVTGWRGTSTIGSSMVSLGIFKFSSTLVIKKKQRLPTLMGRSPTVACLSVCAMRRERFNDTKLCLNWEKSHFMVKEGIVLGHKISKHGIEVDKAKVDVITKLPHPTTVKGVRIFLGHAGFYRRFIKDFSKISRPMTHLLEKDTPFIFSEDCIKAFQTLKQKLTKAPILIGPNWDLPFELMCDASDFAIVAVLGQRYEKHFRPIHYASKTLTEAESNYTTTEKEMLAVVYAFEKFWSYLIMNKCIVHTDHSALKYLFAKKDAKARLLRWVLLLQEFDFDVLDTKGAKNLADDHLSRLKNPYENVFDPKEINETFPLETLSTVTFRGDSSAPWFADFANYHA